MPGSNGDNGSLALNDSGFGWDVGVQYPQVSGGVPGSSNSNPSVLASLIEAGGRITSSIINNRSQADLLKYSSVGSPGFLYTSGIAGQRPATATIGSTTLILIAVAAVVVLFLFTRKAG